MPQGLLHCIFFFVPTSVCVCVRSLFLQMQS